MTTAASFVFAVGRDIYVSPNVPRPPSAGELSQLDVQFSDPLLPSDAMHLRYADDRFPYLGFVMPDAPYTSALLRPLHCTRNTLPIRLLKGQYCLDPGLAASWDELESNLRILASKLFEHFSPGLPWNFEAFPFPEDCGYRRGRHTEDGMRRAAMKARKAFGPLIALCSFAVAMTPQFTQEAPEWLLCLSKNGGHPRWLQELQRTPIVNFSPLAGRIGVIIRPKGLFLEYIPRFVKANVPVWLLWNQVADYTGTKCNAYRPTEEAVAAAKRFAQLRPTYHPPSDCMPLVAASALGQPPEPEKFSGQRRGESVHEFMERRAEKDALRQKTESLDAHSDRMQRIASAEAYPLPGKRGAKVFEWEKEGSYWIRRVMSRALVEQRWGDIPPGHLRYNSFANEWDLCELFDPTAELPADEEYDDLEHDYIHGLAVEKAGHEMPRARTLTGATNGQDVPMGTNNLEEAYAPFPNRGAFTQPEPLDVVLRSRYGFSGYPYSSMPEALSWHFARKTLSDTQSFWARSDLQATVCHFVRSTISDRVPPELCDMSPSSASPITSCNDYLLVERVANGSRVFYRIVPRCSRANEDPVWDLLVSDSITAVECIRRSHAQLGKVELVNFFLQTGRPFSTRMPIHPAPPPPLTPRLGKYSTSGLGERHVNYKPDVIDYKGYERDRTTFLLSDRARAALLEGGIVWRLAIEHLKFDDVMGGPVDLDSGLYERFDGEPVGGWDDKLTNDELDLICGVYKIFLGESNTSSILPPMVNEWPQPRRSINRPMPLGGLRAQPGKPVAWTWATGPRRARNGSSDGWKRYGLERRM